MSELIPNGSSITEAMISDFQSRFGMTRAQAIAALDDIEAGRIQAPEGLPRSTYAAILTKNEGQSIRQKVFGVIKQAGTQTGAAVIGGLVVLTGIWATQVNTTTLNANRINATSTGVSISASGTAELEDLDVSGQVEAPRFLSTVQLPLTSGTTTPASFQMTDATGTWTIVAAWIEQSTSTSGGNVRYVAGTSTGMTVTSTSPIIDITLARAATGPEQITPTSTLMSAYAPVAAGEWFNVMSPTSVHDGVPNVIYKR